MNKKEQIVAAALELLVNQGIQETPMSQISKESGVAMGTIYHHFKSKNDIINYIYTALKKEIGEVLIQDIDLNGDYKLQFFKIWENLFYHYYNQKIKFNYCQYIGNLPVIDMESKIEAQTYFAPAVDFFLKGIESKILKEVDINLMTETIHGNVVSLVQLTHSSTIQITDKYLNQAINMSWDSIKNI